MNKYIQDETLRKKNIRTAWMVAGFSIFILVTSVPFWMGLSKLMGEQVK